MCRSAIGKRRPGYMFTDADLTEFIEAQTRKDVPCPSSATSRSPFWRYDFQWRGHRFFGSTKATTKRQAEAVESSIREQAKQQVAEARAAATSLRLDDVAGRYWNEVGQHHAGADNTWRQIEKLIEFFGKDKIITEISGNDTAKLVAWRRGHRVRKGGRLISAFTVNDTTEQLKKLFTRKMWGVRFDKEPIWRKHRLPEPQVRVGRECDGRHRHPPQDAFIVEARPVFHLEMAEFVRRCETLNAELALRCHEHTGNSGPEGKRRAIPSAVSAVAASVRQARRRRRRCCLPPAASPRACRIVRAAGLPPSFRS